MCVQMCVCVGSIELTGEDAKLVGATDSTTQVFSAKCCLRAALERFGWCSFFCNPPLLFLSLPDSLFVIFFLTVYFYVKVSRTHVPSLSRALSLSGSLSFALCSSLFPFSLSPSFFLSLAPSISTSLSLSLSPSFPASLSPSLSRCLWSFFFSSLSRSCDPSLAIFSSHNLSLTIFLLHNHISSDEM